MPNRPWPLHDAKNRFSAVVDAALAGEPQWVTRRGKAVSVVVSAETWEQMQCREKAAAPAFNRLLLEMPQDGERFERRPLGPREVEF